MAAASPSRGRALIALLRPDARRWVGLGALVAIGAALTLAGPMVILGVVDRAGDGAPASEFVGLVALFLAIAIATQVIAVVVARQATITAWDTTSALRLRITHHVLGLDHEFHRRHTPGELIQRVDGDVTSVSEFLGRVVPKVAGGAMLVAGILVVLTVLDWRLGLGMAVFLAGSVAVVAHGRHRAVRESSDELGSYARLYGGIEERLTAAEELRANGAGVHAVWRFVEDSAGVLIRVIDLLAVEPTIVDRGTTSPPAGALAVSVQDVSFGYGSGPDADDDRILHDLDVDIAAGRSVGVVGRTGSGKTTFSRLLLRLVEAPTGVVALGGVPISDIPMAELRRRVALVPQEVELFEGTIRDNVTLFDPAPSDGAVADALRQVGLDALVAGGIHRRLGAGGAGLSAGEAQLLALARVWLRQPDLVVLDEATARVDPVTEARLEAAVAQLLAGRTTLIIAHKLSTLRLVDEIIVFDRGRIVEHDRREVLSAKGGSRYRYLLELALEVDVETAS